MPKANVAPYQLVLDGTSFTVRRWEGAEAVSSLFRFEVVFESDDLSLALDWLVGKPGSLSIAWRSGGPDSEDLERSVYGIVARASQVGLAETREKRARALYTVQIVPRLWNLTLRCNCRIFQDKRTDEIILKVLKDHGIKAADVEKKLQGACRKRTYCVQYRESDFAFVSRLLEEEGIAYYFKFQNNKDILVLGNYPKAHTPTEPEKVIRYHAPTGQDIDRQYVSECRYTEEVVSGATALQDFNFTAPKTSLYSEKKGKRYTSLEVYDYPGIYEVKGDGQSLAGVRLEEAGHAEKTLAGKSNCCCISAGRQVELKDHFRDALNQAYMVLRVVHRGDVSGSVDSVGGVGYSNEFTAMPASVPFRPPRKTPRPVVEGPQTAIVVGPSGEEIYVDEYGRVKLQFHWDREGKYDEKSSCWVRVSHGWAGGKWGAIYIPRVGHEVIVEFLEGDPDRPIITGRVYNKETMPPYDLPGEKTKSTLKSKTYRGEGTNEIRYEDKKGKEQLLIHAQKDMHVRVTNDRVENVEHDRHLTVDNNKTELVKKNKTVHIQGWVSEKVDGILHVTCGQDVIEEIKMNHKHDVKMTYAAKGMNIKLEGDMEIELKVGGNSIVLSPAGIFIQGTMVYINTMPGPPVAPVVVRPPTPDKLEKADDVKSGKDVRYEK